MLIGDGDPAGVDDMIVRHLSDDIELDFRRICGYDITIFLLEKEERWRDITRTHRDQFTTQHEPPAEKRLR